MQETDPGVAYAARTFASVSAGGAGRASKAQRTRKGKTRGSRAHQCRKWRRPVKTIAMPAASAAAITSASLTEPPGWMIGRDARRRSGLRGRPGTERRRPSAATAPFARGRPSPTASRQASTRLVRPPPIPYVAVSPATTIAFETTPAGRRVREAERASRSPSVGVRFVTTFQAALVVRQEVALLRRGGRRRSPRTSRRGRGPASGATVRTRRFGFFARTGFASSVTA